MWTRTCILSLLRGFKLIHAFFGIGSLASLLKNPLISLVSQIDNMNPFLHPAFLYRYGLTFFTDTPKSTELFLSRLVLSCLILRQMVNLQVSCDNVHHSFLPDDLLPGCEIFSFSPHFVSIVVTPRGTGSTSRLHSLAL